MSRVLTVEAAERLRREWMAAEPGTFVCNIEGLSFEERLILHVLVKEGFFEAFGPSDSPKVYRRTEKEAPCTAQDVAEARFSMQPEGFRVPVLSLNGHERAALNRLVDQGKYVYVYSAGAYERIEDMPVRGVYSVGEEAATPHRVREYPEAFEFTPAMRDVVAERRRQVHVEGFDASHDDQYLKDELSDAAIAYVDAKYQQGVMPPYRWPWTDKWWKPKDHRTNLVKAAALLIAEIERLDRSCKSETECSTAALFPSSSPSYPLARR